MIPDNWRFQYTDKEVQYIKDNYPFLKVKAIAEKLGRPYQGIVCKANDMGIKTCERNTFTEDEEQFIRDNYLTMKYKDIAKHLGRGRIAINKKVNRMKLKKNNRP